MAQKPIPMEKLKQVFQLQRDGISIREIARRVGISRNRVRKYLTLLTDCEEVDDVDMASKAYCNDLLELKAERLRQVTVHFSTAGTELSKTGVTWQLLWREYLAAWLNIQTDTMSRCTAPFTHHPPPSPSQTSPKLTLHHLVGHDQ